MLFMIILCALVVLFLLAVTVFFFYTFVRNEKESHIVFKNGDKEYFGEYYKPIFDGAQYIMSQKFKEHRIKSFDGLTLYGR